MRTMKKRIGLSALLLAAIGATCIWPDSNETAYASGPIPAFPGAEGFGMYATGGRGGDVYEVTNLNDSGPGSFREAVSQGNRTIVFRVGGTIELNSPLTITSSNLTIAGQTAPGDGIAVIGRPVQLSNTDNVIMRHMRFRLGDRNNLEADTFYMGNSTNIIIDHCSFLWGVDEVFSAYPNESVTVQWSVIGEALNTSVHSKGSHGFGGIWGSGTSYHHNLITHNSDRNPRFMTYMEPPYPNDRLIDLRNNVIYDWGSVTSHSGQGLDFNMVNNYYKWGPSTQTARKNMIFTGGENSTAHISGNYMDGSAAVTADNMLGVINPGATVTFSPAEVPRSSAYPTTSVTTHTAEQAYELVLADAGATLPKRDSADARVMAQVQERTGRIIDSQREVGGYTAMQGGTAPLDSDHDGMPDAWELLHGLDPNHPSDRNGDMNNDGYTNLEQYLNGIMGNGSNNPQVSIVSPGLDSFHTAGGSMTIQAAASDSDGTIAKVQFFADDVLLGEALSAPYSYTWSSLPEGTYSITARAIDDSGTSTSTPARPVYIHNTGSISPWSSADIGTPDLAGHADLTNGEYTVKSGGAIRGTADAFHYMYRPLSGNGEVIVRVDEITRTNQQAKAGIMLRQTLASDSRMVMLALDLNAQKFDPALLRRSGTGNTIQTTTYEAGVPLSHWLKLLRYGERVIVSHSQDGLYWTKLGETTFPSGAAYIGLAADPGQEPTLRLRYNTSRFSHVVFNEIPPLPEAPHGLTASRSASDVRLSWEPVSGADSYTVKRSLTSGGPYRTVGSSVYGHFVDNSMEAGTNYFYVVHAVNTYGESFDYSEEASGALLGTNPLTALTAEDFETATLGSRVPPRIVATPGNETNYAIVSAVPPGSTGNGSSLAVELSDSSTAQTVASVAIPPQSGLFAAEADFMLPQSVTPIRAFKVMNGNRAHVEILVYNGVGCPTVPCFSYRSAAGYTALPANNSFSPNTWYNIRAEVDVPNETASISINGQLAGTIPFFYGSGWTVPASMNAIGTQTASTAQTSVFWDNMRIGVYGLPAAAALTGSGDHGAAELSWTAVDGAESYHVYRMDTGLNRYVRIAGGVTQTTFTDEDVSGGAEYVYVVAAVRALTGEGEYSAPVEVTVAGATVQSVTSMLTGYRTSGVMDEALYRQLDNSLRQAEHHHGIGNSKQAAHFIQKMMEDLDRFRKTGASAEAASELMMAAIVDIQRRWY
ncbi:MAG: hypothetical protein K0Q94_403 [Paenibacillus sp.]|uniref:Ig-like domain-containing protein n=1 Tax=Paenibacillus sp. GCM10012303 TaxID=3317340 RepID=UPI0029ED2F73|nr:hypothetical protein [Paenibacillus sp.]